MNFRLILPFLFAVCAVLRTGADPSSTAIVTGNITVPGERDVFTFTRSEESRFYFDPLTNSNSLNWSLSGVEGVVVTNRSFSSSGSQSSGDPTVSLVPGDYKLTIQASGGNTGNYAFRFVNLVDSSLLSPGTLITNTFSPANRTAFYQFTGNAGDRFFFDQTATVTLPYAEWRLFDRFGNQIFSQGFSDVGSPGVPVTVPVTGSYFLVVEGNTGDSGSGSYSFVVTPEGNTPPVPFTGTPINLGDLITGQFTANTTNAYTFTLTDRKAVVFDNQTNSPQLNWTLLGPAGQIVNQRGFNNSDAYAQAGPWSLAEGSYQLLVKGSGNDPFRFRLVDLASASSITKGALVVATLNPANSTALYRFSGSAGEKIYVDSVGATNLPNAFWRLIDPNGYQMFGASINGDQGPFVLNVSGNYTLLVEGYFIDSGTGSLGFNILPVADQLHAYTLGNLVSDAIASAGQRQQYTFTLASPTTLYFDSRTNSSSVRWSLDGPFGTVVNTRSFNGSDALSIANPLINATAGNYTLTVFGNSDFAGPYQFRLFDIASATPLIPGNPVVGNLNPANSTEAYRFTVNTTARYFLNYQSSSGLDNTSVRLVDVYGHTIINQGFLSVASSFVLSPGIYTLLIEGYIGDSGNGNFAFNLALTDDHTTNLTVGSSVSGNVTAPGQLQRYSFSLGASTSLYFDALTSDSTLRWSLDGPTGNVVNNRTFGGSDAQTISNPILASLPPGDYSLTVFGQGDGIGSYQFRLLDISTGIPLVPGTQTDGTLNPANSTKVYKLDIATSAKYYLDFLSSSGLNNAWLRLVDAYGNILIVSNLSTDNGPFTLAPGSYYILVEGYYGDTGTGNYSFNLRSVQDGTQSLTLGGVTSGAIASPGQKQQYSFSLPSAARLYFDSRVNSGSIRWSLDGPTGNLVNGRGFNGSDAQSGNPLLNLTAGAYTLTVFGSGDSVGGYQFRLFDITTAPTFTPGSPITGTISGGNSTDAYQFTVSTMGRYFYNFQSSTGTQSSYLRLVDPYGNFIFATGIGSDFGPVTLFPGTYYLLVEGYIGDTANANYAFTFGPTSDGAQALTLGTLVSGAITAPGSVQKYTLSLPAFARLYFDSRTNASSLKWSLDGPLGNVVTGRSFNGSDAQSISNPLIGLEAGDYTLTVSGTGDAVGGYTFRLFNLAAAANLTPGTTVTGANFIANATDPYKFNASAGDQFQFVPVSSSGIPNSYWRLIDPYGNQVFGQNFNSGTISRSVPAAGTYTLLLEGYIGDAGTGSYSLNVSPNGNVPPVPLTGSPLVIGNSISQTLAAGDTNAFTFTLTGSRQLYFDALSTSGQNWSLRGPPGLVVNLRSFQGSDSAEAVDPALSLPAGDYQLTVTGSGGAYQFRLLDFGSATPLPAETIITTTLVPASATVLYTFSGTAGNQYYFDGQGYSEGGGSGGSYPAYWRIYTPSGNLLASQYINSHIDSIILPQNGSYTVAVEGRIYDTHINQTNQFALLPVANQTNSLVVGQVVTGASATFGLEHAYTFTLAQDSTLYFDALTNIDFYWRLDAPRGQIVDWRGFASSDGPNIADPLLHLAAGSYTLTVAGNNLRVTGAYKFRLLDFSSGPSFTPGNPVVTTLTPASQTMIYKFPGASGDLYYFDGQEFSAGPGSGGSYPAYVRIYGPLGNLIGAQYVNNHLDTFSLAQNGTYTVLVEGRVEDAHENQTNSFNLIPVTYPTNALTLGNVVSATNDTFGIKRTYTFTLTQNKTLYFDVLTNADFYWRLDSSAGQIFDWRSFTASDSADSPNPLLRLPPGSYTLTVAGTNLRVTGAYQFRLLDLAQGTLFTPGTNVTTTLSPANSTAVYKFNGTEGDLYYFDGLGFGDGPGAGSNYAPYARIYDPLANLVAAQYLNNHLDTFSLTQSGTYTLLVEGRFYESHASATNTFNLIPISYPTNTLAIGELVTGTNAVFGLQHFYTFNLAQDATLYFDSLTNASFSWRLDSPQGPVIDWRSFNSSDSSEIADPTFRLPAGSYILTVAGDNLRTVGAYQFRLLDFANAATLVPGTVVSNALTPAKSTSIYRFNNSTAGSRYYFDSQSVTGFVYPPYVRLYGPGGIILFAQSLNSDVDTFVLPLTGTYTLTVEGRVFETNPSGNYSFNLVPVPAPVGTPLFGNGTPPDLIVTDVSVSPASGLLSGASATIHWKDRNIGTGVTTGSFSDRLTIRNSANLVLVDTIVPYNEGDVGNGPLLASDIRNREVVVVLPDGTNSVGTLQVTVTTDTLSNIGEASEVNNSTAFAFSVGLAPYPDLVVDHLTATPPTRWLPGSNVTVGWRVTNVGNGAVANDWTDLVVVRNTNSSLVIASSSTNYNISLAGEGPVAPGEFRDRSVTFKVPANSTAYGVFSVTVTANSGKSVFEYNAAGTAEQNNSASGIVMSAPDLVPTGINVTANGPIRSGASITVTWSDANNGTVDIGAGFYDQVVLFNADTGESLLNTVYYYDPSASGNGGIAPGASKVRTTTLNLPDGLRGSGNFQVRVDADVYNYLPEVNNGGTGELNNSGSSGFVSALAPYSDLLVTGLSVQPDVLGAGTNVTIRWKDTNSGNGFTAGSWYDHVTIVNTNSAVSLLDTVVYFNEEVSGRITNGTARDRVYNFTLPNDTDASGNLRFQVSADIYNSVFEYNSAGTAENNNTSSIVLPLVATPLPDLVVTSITTPPSALANHTVAGQFRLENRGTAGATNSTTQRVFISTSPSPGSGTLVAQVDVATKLGTNALTDQSFSFLAPSAPGTYWLIVQADSANNVVESRESNNYFVAPTAFTVDPTYNATVTADVHSALAGTSIPMHGVATLAGSANPAALVPVTIHIQVRGTDRTFPVLSGPDGSFALVFHPISTEAGDYQVAATFPGLLAGSPQDQFTLIGMTIDPIGLVNLTEGDSITNLTHLVNLSDVPLSGLAVQVVTNQANLVVQASLESTSLAGFASTGLKLSIRSLDASIVQSPVVLRVTSAEGAVADLTVTVRIEALRPRLVANPTSLQRAMQRGVQTPLAFTISNQGGIPTDPLQVVLPNVPWLALASKDQLPALAPGSNAVVTVLLTPAADLALGDYNGTIVVASSNAAVQVPFSFRAVSDAKGSLLLTAEDEYTYFAAGSPRVTNALVKVTDALSGAVVGTNVTGVDGTILFTNLTEAYYIIDVSAEGHTSFRESALVLGNATTNVVAFLTRQTVQYSFTVTPTTIPDQYTLVVDSTFETQVPVPVVTIEPASLDLAQYQGDEFQVQYTISNRGLIDAAHVNLNIPSTANLIITPLVTNLGKLPANSSVVVPVLIKRVSANSLATGKAKPKGAGSGQCSVTGQMLWDYLCGPNVVDKNTAVYVFDSTGCDLVSLYSQVYDLVPDNPGGGGGGGPVLTSQDYFDYLNQFQPVLDFGPPPGYHFQCKTAPGAPSPLSSAHAKGTQASGASSNVCAKVEIRLSQRAVVARDAFKATLEIDNEQLSTLENIKVNLQITDLNGVPVIENFAVTPSELSGITSIDGSGTLQPQTVGSANWTIIPTLDAAPVSGVTIYLVSGTLSYEQDGIPINVPLAAAPIQVYPQPELDVLYFHDRNVYGDDPFTPQIEPSIPYSLAIQVRNVGHGAAQSLTISSAKPQIVDNVKGLLVDFKILGTQLENETLSSGLDASFGRVEPGTNKIARWLFSSTIQGSFTNFSASFSQVDQFGKPRLSLIRNVEIHELIHIVDANGPGADGRPDFLVNDVSDNDFLPDTLYLSDGSVAPVAANTSGTFSGNLDGTHLSLTLNVGPSVGWTYFQVGDPGQGQFRLNRVVRQDGTEVPFGTNVWTTDRNFRGSDLVPILTNLVHLLDYNSSGSYTLFYQPISAQVTDTTAPISSVSAMSGNSPADFVVQWSGSDAGSGIALYDIMVSTNGGPFGPWLLNTTLSRAIFNGAPNTTYGFYSRATDSAGNRENAHSGADASTVTTGAQNQPPVISPVPVQSIVEGDLFTFTPTASNDSVSETLTWSLTGDSPAGALIVPTTGRINWQTSVGQGGATNHFILVATDNGSPSLSATQSFNVVVAHSNLAPVIGAFDPQIYVDQGGSLSFQPTATDGNPQDILTWQLGPGFPSGLTINSGTGLLTWTPTAAQTPSTNIVQLVVRDNGVPSLSATNTFSIVVRKINHAPILSVIGSQEASVLNLLLVTNSATDLDAGSFLTFSLEAGAPLGAKVNPVTGVFSWIPSLSQGGTASTITVRVTDNGVPALSNTTSFNVEVSNFVEVILGSVSVASGQNGTIPIGVDLSAPITNLDFTFTVEAAGLTNFSLVSPASPLAVATLETVDGIQFKVSLQSLPGQTIPASDVLSSINFTSLSAAPSGFVPIVITGVSAHGADGASISRTLGLDSRVALVNTAPLLEALNDGNLFQLKIYGLAGVTHVVESSLDLRFPITWSPFWTGIVHTPFELLTVEKTNTATFFRARKQ